jgi:hypothetical protein
MQLARLAAKKAVQDQLRAQGVRVSLVPFAVVMRQAREYLDAHPELYQQALERARRMGYIGPPGADILINARIRNEPNSITSTVRMLGAKMTTIGYARVSTDGQTLDAQRKA